MESGAIFINLLSDFGFKRMFGTTRNKTILINMLNSFLAKHVGILTDVNFLPTELLGFTESEKKVNFDLYCTTQNNDNIIIEMQRASQKFFSDRIISYVSRAISNNIEKGDMEYKIPIVVSLNLMDHNSNLFKRKKDFFRQVMLKDEENEIFSEKMLLYFVNLTNFAGSKDKFDFSDERQKWAYHIANMENLSEADIPKDDAIIRSLFEECRISKLNAMEKIKYRKSLNDYEDVKRMQSYYFEQGEEKGFAKGEAKGKAEGKAEGAAEAKRKMVLSMLEKGLDIKFISEVTGLSENEIQNIGCEH